VSQYLKDKIAFLDIDTSHWKSPVIVHIIPDYTFETLYHESNSLRQFIRKCKYIAKNISVSKIKKQMEKLNLENKFKSIRQVVRPIKLRAIDDDNYRITVKNCTNALELGRKCGYKFISSKIRSLLINRAITLNIDMSHWKKSNQLTTIRIKDIFVKDSLRVTNETLKHRLINELKWPYECRKCKNKTFETSDGVLMWMDEPIELELEHKNGDNKDNRLENLEFLCTYCHSQTSTYKGKNCKKSRLMRAWIEE
jgi:hypothetical protein